QRREVLNEAHDLGVDDDRVSEVFPALHDAVPHGNDASPHEFGSHLGEEVEDSAKSFTVVGDGGHAYRRLGAVAVADLAAALPNALHQPTGRCFAGGRVDEA